MSDVYDANKEYYQKKLDEARETDVGVQREIFKRGLEDTKRLGHSLDYALEHADVWPGIRELRPDKSKL